MAEIYLGIIGGGQLGSMLSVAAKKLNIKVIFAEENTSTKTSQVIADEIGGKVLVLSPLEVVSDEEDYVSKMTQNLENLREALC